MFSDPLINETGQKQSDSLQIITEVYQILAASEPWSDLHRMNCTTWSDARSRETHCRV